MKLPKNITLAAVIALCVASISAAHCEPANVASFQKQLATNAAATSALIEDNAEILSPDCLAQVEVLWRGMRNAYSSTGGQLPLYAPPFDRQSPEFRGYVAALVDQSRKTSMQIESMVTYNCQDPNATAFFRGEVVGRP